MLRIAVVLVLLLALLCGLMLAGCGSESGTKTVVVNQAEHEETSPITDKAKAQPEPLSKEELIERAIKDYCHTHNAPGEAKSSVFQDWRFSSDWVAVSVVAASSGQVVSDFVTFLVRKNNSGNWKVVKWLPSGAEISETEAAKIGISQKLAKQLRLNIYKATEGDIIDDANQIGLLVIETSKPGHFVVEGKGGWYKTGSTNTLPVGTHKITTAVPGYLNETITVTVKPRETTRVKVVIKPDPADAQIIEGAPVPEGERRGIPSLDQASEKKAIQQVINDYDRAHLRLGDKYPVKYSRWRFVDYWCAVIRTVFYPERNQEGGATEFVLWKADKWRLAVMVEDGMTTEDLVQAGIPADVIRKLKIEHRP